MWWKEVKAQLHHNLVPCLPPPAPVAPSTQSAIPLPQLPPGRGQALVSRVFKLRLWYMLPAEGQTLDQPALHTIETPG